MTDQAWYPRFGRVDRFPASASALSALCQLDQIGVEPADIRLILEGRRRQETPRILEQHPDPGTPIRHGVEVMLRLAEDSLLDRFPERAFVSLPGREGREQVAAARRLFAPFDKARLLALARLRYWNAVFSGAHGSEDYELFLHRVLGLTDASCERARRVFSADQLRAWLRILPLLPRFAGDLPATAQILAWFLGDPVSAGSDDGPASAIPAAWAMHTAGSAQPAAAGRASRARVPLARRTLPPARPAEPGGPAPDETARPPAALGKGFMGEAAAEIGTGAWFAIGPLAPDRAAAYAGLPFTTRPGAHRHDHAFVVDLGYACDLDGLWKEWEAQRPDLLATRWPMIAHVLLHLVPAHLAVAVRLRAAVGAGWTLGIGGEPAPAAVPAAGAPTPAAVSAAGAPAPDDVSAAGEPRAPSTLGAWTALAPASPPNPRP